MKKIHTLYLAICMFLTVSLSSCESEKKEYYASGRVKSVLVYEWPLSDTISCRQFDEDGREVRYAKLSFERVTEYREDSSRYVEEFVLNKRVKKVLYDSLGREIAYEDSLIATYAGYYPDGKIKAKNFLSKGKDLPIDSSIFYSICGPRVAICIFSKEYYTFHIKGLPEIVVPNGDSKRGDSIHKNVLYRIMIDDSNCK